MFRIPFFNRSSPLAGSHVGGRLAAGSQEPPLCQHCRAEMPLFFQVEWTPGSHDTKRQLAVSACVSCTGEDRIIPTMPKDHRKGCSVSSSFLKSSQTNFRLVITDVNSRPVPAKPAPEESAILPKRLEADHHGVLRCDGRVFGRLGGKPEWIMEDETPGLCDQQEPFAFVCQIDSGWLFETRPKAAPQITLDLAGNPAPSRRPGYRLFNGNAAYFFATTVDGQPMAYVITQCQ
ncbi:MAG TPA: hypothetical protein VGE29_13670 [Prosthecobacter sp.]